MAFDVVVCGTSSTQSLLGAALARRGLSVLHVDANCHYGGNGATISWQTFFQCSQVTQQYAKLAHWQQRVFLPSVKGKTTQVFIAGGGAGVAESENHAMSLRKLYSAPLAPSATRRFAWRVTECSIPQTWRGGAGSAQASFDAWKCLGAQFDWPGRHCPPLADALMLAQHFNIDLRPRAVLCRGKPVPPPHAQTRFFLFRTTATTGTNPRDHHESNEPTIHSFLT